MQAWAHELKSSGQQLDYAIHVAGVVDDYADLDEVDEQRMLHCFRTNTIGPVLTVQALLEQKLLGNKSVLAILTSKVCTVLPFSCLGDNLYLASSDVGIVT